MPHAIPISNTVTLLRAIKAPLATSAALLLCLQTPQAGAVERINTARVKQRAWHLFHDAVARISISRVFKPAGPFADTVRAVDRTPSAGVPPPSISTDGMPFLTNTLRLAQSNGIIYRGQAGFILRRVWHEASKRLPESQRAEIQHSGDLSPTLRYALATAVRVSELLKQTAGIPSKAEHQAPVVMNKHQAPVVMNKHQAPVIMDSKLAYSIATLLKEKLKGNKNVNPNPELANELATALHSYLEVCGEAAIDKKTPALEVADVVLERLSSSETHKSAAPQSSTTE